MNPRVERPRGTLSRGAPTRVNGAMRRLAEEGMTMIIVTHEIPFARDVSDRIIFMDGGAIVEQGPPAQVLAAPASARLKLFLRRYQGDYLAV